MWALCGYIVCVHVELLCLGHVELVFGDAGLLWFRDVELATII